MANIKLRAGIGITLLFFAASAFGVPAGTVTQSGTHFYIDGGVYYFAGTNCYDLFTMPVADINTRMAQMAADGVRVLRTWGFCHQTYGGFEITKGKYEEGEFMVFDAIMEAARANGMRVVIVLENYWADYGGIDSRLQWEGLPFGDYTTRCAFFTNAACKQGYKNYIAHFVNRVNSISGMPYKEDPVVFAWQLMNEPRYQNATPDENSTGTTFRAWIDEMSAYIKSLDPNHLVSLGIEGHQAKYGFGGDEGNPFIYSHQSPGINYCTAHPYPNETWANLTLDQTKTLVNAWIADSHTSVGKPFIMDEFNTISSSVDRATWWTAIFGVLENTGAAGSCFWEYEGRNTDSKYGVPNGAPELSVFRTHSANMAAKSAGGPPPKTVPGLNFKAGDFQVTGYITQADGINAYYHIACQNMTTQGFQGNVKIRVYVTLESGTTIGTHYEESTVYVGNPTISSWLTDGGNTYYEADFGNRGIVPGNKIGFQGGLSLSGGGLNLANDWSLAAMTTTSAALPRVIVYIGGKVAAGELPTGAITPEPTAVPTIAPTAGPTSVPTTAPTPSGLKGDLNGSGTVDIVDALLIAQFYVGLNPANFNQAVADVNCSGTIDIVDALVVAQFYVGLLASFPC
jgi:hypothetical protein